MRVEGLILPVGEGSGVNYDAWCRLVARRPEFRPPPTRVIINPFTQRPTATPPNPDVASVVVDGVRVGDVYWSMDEDTPLAIVSIERVALVLAHEWAAELCGEFLEYRST